MWLMADGESASAAWAKNHGIAAVDVASLSPHAGKWYERAIYGRIGITPTRVILSEDLVVLDVRRINELPADAELVELCRSQ